MNHIPRDLRRRLDNKSAHINPRFKASLRSKLLKKTTMSKKSKSSTPKQLLTYVRSTPFLAVFAALVIVGTSSALVATNRTNNSRDAEVAVPSDLEELMSFDEIRAIAAKDAGNATIKGVELEKEDGRTVYKVKFSDGSVRIYDTKSGDAIKDASDTERDDDVPADFTGGITLAEARRIALEQRSGTIVKIELDNEDGAIVYSVRYSDGGRVDVNATDGSVLRVRGAKSSNSTVKQSSDDDKDDDDSKHRSGSKSVSDDDDEDDDDENEDEKEDSDDDDDKDDRDDDDDRSGKSNDD